MGTRNLTKVIDADGNLRVAQYGQFDGYPSGQGITALYHLNYDKGGSIERGLARVRWAEQAELDAIYASLPEFNYIGRADNNKFELRYPNLTRNTASEILAVIAFSVGEVILVNSADFEQDTLMCEGVYTVDFQRRMFISKFDGREIEFSLDDLPDPQEYLDAWKSVVSNP